MQETKEFFSFGLSVNETQGKNGRQGRDYDVRYKDVQTLQIFLGLYLWIRMTPTSSAVNIRLNADEIRGQTENIWRLIELIAVAVPFFLRIACVLCQGLNLPSNYLLTQWKKHIGHTSKSYVLWFTLLWNPMLRPLNKSSTVLSKTVSQWVGLLPVQKSPDKTSC